MNDADGYGYAIANDLGKQLDAMKVLNAELLEALVKITRTHYHIERPPILSLEEQMRQIASSAIAKATQGEMK